MVKILKNAINRLKRKLKVIIYKNITSDYLAYEEWIICNLKPDVFIDVGANRGQHPFDYCKLRSDLKFICLEPVKHLFDELVEKSHKKPNWININLGVSDKKGNAEINVMGGHGGTSSILKPTKHLAENAGTAGVIEKKEKISLTTLDDVITQHCPNEKDIYIKVDVQGFELRVIKGLNKHIDKLLGCRLEMALNTSDYENQPGIQEIIMYMHSKGFELVHLQPTWSHPKTKELLYVDGVFLNNKYKKQ